MPIKVLKLSDEAHHRIKCNAALARKSMSQYVADLVLEASTKIDEVAFKEACEEVGGLTKEEKEIARDKIINGGG